MMGHREKTSSGMEYDLLGAKRFLCVFNHPRVAHGVKKQMARRARRQARQSVRREPLCR